MQEDKDKKASSQMTFWTIALVTVIIIGVLYFTYIRYSLVSKTIDTKDTLTGALLLSPEIATGIVSILGVF